MLFLKIRKEKLGETHHEVATIHHNVGDVYYVLRNYSKSMDAYEIAFQVRVSNLGSDNIDVAATRNNMGVCLLKLGENEKGKLLVAINLDGEISFFTVTQSFHSSFLNLL